MKLTTSDGYTLAYTYTPPFDPKGAPGAILLHQLNRDRHDYDQFGPRLADQGFGVIAIDSRGHGESSGKWEEFSNADFQDIVNDIDSAKEFLKTQGIDTTRLVLIGASVNANAAIKYAVKDHDVKTLIALSPGIEYRGIKTSGAIMSAPANTWLVAAADDDYSEQSVIELSRINPAVGTKIYPAGGHGTFMLSSTDLPQDIFAWVKDA